MYRTNNDILSLDVTQYAKKLTGKNKNKNLLVSKIYYIQYRSSKVKDWANEKESPSGRDMEI